MASNARNSLIVTPSPRIAQVIVWGARACGSRRGAFVRRNLFLFLIHLPLSVAKFAAFFWRGDNKNRIFAFI